MNSFSFKMSFSAYFPTLSLSPFSFYSFMFDTVNHHSTHLVHSSSLSRRSARCFLTQLSLVTDGYWYYQFFHSRRFVRPARLVFRSCIFLCFAFSSLSSSLLSTIRFIARFFSGYSFPLSPALLLDYLGLLGPGVSPSVPFSILLSSAADLNETPFLFSNDPFPFAPYVSSIFQFLMVNVYTSLDLLGPFSRTVGRPSWCLSWGALAILVPWVLLAL